MQFILRYGEIGLKSTPVRRKFEKKLISNILDAFAYHNIECIIHSDKQGRLYLTTQSRKNVKKILRRIFGLTSISEVLITTNATKTAICNAVLKIAEKNLKMRKKFAVRVKRTGIHPYTSMELASYIGRKVLQKYGMQKITVDLTNPDIEFFIEIRHNKAYIFTERIKCIGGLPLATQGTIVAAARTFDDIISAWLMMKRGCKVIMVCDKKITSSNFFTQLKMWDVNLNAIVVEKKKEFMDVLRKNAIKYKADGIVSSIQKIDKDLFNFLPVFNPILCTINNEIAHLKKIFLT